MTDDSLWYAMPTLVSARVRLEPLTLEHTPGYLAAAGTPTEAEEIFRWQSPAGGALGHPVTTDDARAHVTSALAARARGTRLPYALIDTTSGSFAGTTSFADPDPRLRTLTIGYTWLGRRWWGTGLNAEAKMLMLTCAFESLGAVRVVLVTDIRNTRAQAAIERLGAQREGILRKHRRRADGSWRDTVTYALIDDDWPAAKKTSPRGWSARPPRRDRRTTTVTRTRTSATRSRPRGLPQRSTGHRQRINPAIAGQPGTA